jgi:hypothetical protein
MTTTTTEPTTTTAGAINAKDFSESTTDVLRERWTLGKMQAVIQALEGRHVLIVVDKQTGHALVNVRLTRAFHGGPSRGDRVTVESTYEDGSGRPTNYRLDDIGVIVELERGRTIGAKWDALEIYRNQRMAAIMKAQAEHGDPEGRSWGRWKGTPYGDGLVGVEYEPLTGNPAFADKWGKRGYWNYRVVDGVATAARI